MGLVVDFLTDKNDIPRGLIVNFAPCMVYFSVLTMPSTRPTDNDIPVVQGQAADYW